MTIRKITFEEILPKWQLLWPGKEKILPVNCHRFLGGTSEDYVFAKVTYLGYYIDDELVGVCSGYKNNDILYRARGFWIDENYRGKHIFRKLIQTLSSIALLEGCQVMWTMGRKSSWEKYKACGFAKIGDWFSEGVEFGPNAYMYKELKNYDS